MNRRVAGVAVVAAALVGCTSSAATEAPGGATTPPPTFATPTFAAPSATFIPTTSAPPTTAVVTPTSSPAPPPETAPPTSAARAAASSLLAEIGAVTVAPESTGPSYNRDFFGGGWIDVDGNGCDTRCEVLKVERVEIPGGGNGWVSLYDNYSTDDPSELDIDHMVPLAEAWRSGASSWAPARRIAYANDLESSATLIAVTAATNRSKSDKDPAQWQPPNLGAWCTYVRDWVTVKRRWALTADPAEVTALRNMAAARSC